ncbi:hypothetical protein Aca07nite_87930 [Actinoplanes capillaceus]|uniref:Carrier domain-containing protein n=1 Tax=Actinoplanes campanulatus TaxID=113559 RepID=A0ABQ3WZA8_9ACTN|nr:acyl carrier protein [Actinoplanes capillaceus]GID51518.1 hypothetical protein Aca07nite_87930 [Actinoplanes capillaceus]
MTATPDPERTRIEADLEQLVREIGKIDPADTAFKRTTELFDSGYLDSLGIVALTTHITQTYGVTLDEEQLFDPRLTTITGIAEIVAADPSRQTTASPAERGDMRSAGARDTLIRSDT